MTTATGGAPAVVAPEKHSSPSLPPSLSPSLSSSVIPFNAHHTKRIECLAPRPPFFFSLLPSRLSHFLVYIDTRPSLSSVSRPPFLPFSLPPFPLPPALRLLPQTLFGRSFGACGSCSSSSSSSRRNHGSRSSSVGDRRTASCRTDGDWRNGVRPQRGLEFCREGGRRV